MSSNHFKIRKDWPVLPSNKAPTNIITKSYPPTIKTEPQGPNQPRPSPTATKQDSTAMKQEKCRWGLNCPICKNVEENLDGKHQRQLQQPDAKQRYHPQGQDTKQAQDPQHNKKLPQGQNSQISFDVPDQYVEQICLRREWKKKMEQLNCKYGLDCFSDSELDSESDEGEIYKYEHKYETLI